MYAGHLDFAVPLIQRLPALFSPAECQGVLRGLVGVKWLLGTVNSIEGRKVRTHIRDNLTAIIDVSGLADRLWEVAAPHIPKTMSVELDGPRQTLEVVGLYTPLRVYRYREGHRFGLHHDQSYERGTNRSLITLLVYLDDDFEGGETDFPELSEKVVPRVGDGLWFQHPLLHSSNEIRRGTKHVLRTDVLYRG